MFQFIENIFGNGFKIENSESSNAFKVTWKRASFLGIILFVLWIMAIVYGIASFTNMEYLDEMPIIRFEITGQIIYWGICFLVFLQLFFNSKSELKFDGYFLFYQKRKIAFKKWKISKNDISEIETKEVNNWGEDDIPGPRRELLKVKLRLKNGKVIKIDSFGENDAKELKNLIQKTIEKK